MYKSAGNRKDDLPTSFTPTNVVVVGQRIEILFVFFDPKSKEITTCHRHILNPVDIPPTPSCL